MRNFISGNICIFLFSLIPSALAGTADAEFEIQLRPPANLKQCQVLFNRGVPAKATVDKIMEQALTICRTMSPNSNIQVMAFHGDDMLEDAQSTWGWISYSAKMRCVQHVPQSLKFSKEFREKCDR